MIEYFYHENLPAEEEAATGSGNADSEPRRPEDSQKRDLLTRPQHEQETRQPTERRCAAVSLIWRPA